MANEVNLDPLGFKTYDFNVLYYNSKNQPYPMIVNREKQRDRKRREGEV